MNPNQIQRPIKAIKVPDEWIITGGKGTTVAVIDSHVDVNYGKLKKYYTISNGGVFDSGHGNAVYDIISNVAPFCDVIVSQAVFGKRGDSDGLSAAIKKILNDDIDIVNISLSTREDKEEIKSLVYELSKKSLVVASLSNDGFPSYPAEYDFVTAVSSYKNSNPKADIYCEDRFSFGGHNTKKTGNSMSAAFISGIFALAKSYNKNFTKEDVFKILLGK